MWKTTLYETTRLTLELRDIVDNGENSVDIWDFVYPSYYKDVEKKAFEQKVIDHYYFRQIGSETVGRFLHQFRTKIREIMPYYIQLYKSVALMDSIEDPFGNVDITETFEQNTTDTTTSNNTSQSSGTSNSSSETSSEDSRTSSENKQHKFSNTPQGSISNLDNYMTEASTDANNGTEKVNSSGSSEIETSSSGTTTDTGNTSTTGKITHTFTKKGNQGVNTYAHDMKELRETFIDVDMMIIKELNELFLGVY